MWQCVNKLLLHIVVLFSDQWWRIISEIHSTAVLLSSHPCVVGSSKPLLEEGEVESGKDDKKESEARPVTYSYTFFHLIFALASMYSAMRLTGWTSSTSDSSELIDVGWTSVWVRIWTEWATAALYIWTLIAPLVLPDREFWWISSFLDMLEWMLCMVKMVFSSVPVWLNIFAVDLHPINMWHMTYYGYNRAREYPLVHVFCK